jgi:hypothetical protein
VLGLLLNQTDDPFVGRGGVDAFELQVEVDLGEEEGCLGAVEFVFGDLVG